MVKELLKRQWILWLTFITMTNYIMIDPDLCLFSVCPHIYCSWVQINYFTLFSVFCAHIFPHCSVWFNSMLWRWRKKCWPVMLMFFISPAYLIQLPSHFLEMTLMRQYYCLTKRADKRRQLTCLDFSILWCFGIWKPRRRRLVKDIQLTDLHLLQTLT